MKLLILHKLLLLFLNQIQLLEVILMLWRQPILLYKFQTTIPLILKFGLISVCKIHLTHKVLPLDQPVLVLELEGQMLPKQEHMITALPLVSEPLFWRLIMTQLVLSMLINWFFTEMVKLELITLLLLIYKHLNLQLTP